MNNELYHRGTPHVGRIPHSGRYPWLTGAKYRNEDGSIKESVLKNLKFNEKYELWKQEGLSESEMAKKLNISQNEFRMRRSIAQAEEEAALINWARYLKNEKYLTNEQIGRRIGGNDNPLPESTIRGWLKRDGELRNQTLQTVVDVLEEKVKNGEMIDIGKGANLTFGVTQTTFDTALLMLEDKGYAIGTLSVPQPNSPGKSTTLKYIAPEGTTVKDAWLNRDEIKPLDGYSPDNGLQYQKIHYPQSISSDRVYVMFEEDGGTARDGMIGIREGVKDLSLGNSTYAQVRIAVDDKLYCKGMAFYDDSIPKGYDVCVYSNKSKEKGLEGALKPMKDDKEYPFGAVIKANGQNYYKDESGKFVKQGDIYVLDDKNKIKGERFSLGALNKLNEEGDWANYSKRLPAQFLSKQRLELINNQLDLTYKKQVEDYERIMALDNPVVKQKLLEDFAKSCDKAARHLDAASLPRQETKVLMAMPSLKDNECYCPTIKDGTKVALVRYPHGGIFEIPILTVNNKNAEAKKILGNAIDAIGINSNSASILSGADFDGDNCTVIPLSGKIKIDTDDINNNNRYPGLKGFNPSEEYKAYPGMKVIKPDQKQKQMGIVTNLITDMHVQGASTEEITRAVKHSMVIIDSEKHKLNWKLSEKVNGIEELKKKYQINPDSKKGYGSSTTLLSKLGNATVQVNELETVKYNKDGKLVRSFGKGDPESGKMLYRETGATYKTYKKDSKGNPVLDENGNKILIEKKRTSKVSPLDLVDDARKLMSGPKDENGFGLGTPQELAYANHINKMVALSNSARKESLSMDMYKVDSQAAKTYAKEVATLNAKLNLAEKNKPLERRAQVLTNTRIETLTKNDPSLYDKDKKDKFKKIKSRILNEARSDVGAKKIQITFTDKEWEAVQAHAISATKLSRMLNNADMDVVRKLATPKKDTPALTAAKIGTIRSMKNSGYTIADIAEKMNVSTSTISKYLKGDEN